MKDKPKSVEVDSSVLQIIYEASLPIYYRLNSLLKDVMNETILLSEIDKSLLLEFCSASSALKIIFENHIQNLGPSSENGKVALEYQEYAAMLSLSKTVELSSRSLIGGITIQEQ